MKPVARLGDTCTGHSGFPSRECITASDNVIINNRGAHRVGDSWATHCNKSCHDSVLSTGSSTVYVNNMPLGRVGDSIACGSTVITGSDNVMIG